MLIQDDFGLQPLDNGSRMHLMDIIKDRYGKKSTLITSQLPVKDRYDVIGKETIAGVLIRISLSIYPAACMEHSTIHVLIASSRWPDIPPVPSSF